jgi:hypothetical protein
MEVVSVETLSVVKVALAVMVPKAAANLASPQ